MAQNLLFRGLLCGADTLAAGLFAARARGVAKAPVAVDELVAEAAAVAEEVAVHLAIVAVEDASQLAVALAGDGIAADAAVHADRRRRLAGPTCGCNAASASCR